MAANEQEIKSQAELDQALMDLCVRRTPLEDYCQNSQLSAADLKKYADNILSEKDKKKSLETEKADNQERKENKEAAENAAVKEIKNAGEDVFLDCLADLLNEVIAEANQEQTHRDKLAIGKLLEQGAQLNFMHRTGNTPLQNTIIRGNEALLRHLLLNHADPNLESNTLNEENELSNERLVPLDQAVLLGRIGMTQLLISFKAEVNHVNGFDKRPITYAAQHRLVDVMKVLIASNANVKVIDSFHWSLMTSCVGGYDNPQVHEYVRILQNYGDIVEDGIYDEGRRLFISSMEEMPETAKTGEQIKRSYNLETKKTQEMIQFLAAQGLDVNHIPYDESDEPSHQLVLANGQSPLMSACYIGGQEVVECLIREKADIHLASRRTQHPLNSALGFFQNITPILVAAARGHFKIVRMLQNLGANKHQVANIVIPVDRNLENRVNQNWTIFRFALHLLCNDQISHNSSLWWEIGRYLSNNDIVSEFDPEDAEMMRTLEDAFKIIPIYQRNYEVYQKIKKMMDFWLFLRGKKTSTNEDFSFDFFPNSDDYRFPGQCFKMGAHLFQRTAEMMDTPLHLVSRSGDFQKLNKLFHVLRKQNINNDDSGVFYCSNTKLEEEWINDVLKLLGMKNNQKFTPVDCIAQFCGEVLVDKKDAEHKKITEGKELKEKAEQIPMLPAEEIREKMREEFEKILIAALVPTLQRMRWVFNLRWDVLGNNSVKQFTNKFHLERYKHEIPNTLLQRILSFVSGIEHLSYTDSGNKFVSKVLNRAREAALTAEFEYQKGILFLTGGQGDFSNYFEKNYDNFYGRADKSGDKEFQFCYKHSDVKVSSDLSKAMICFYRAAKRNHILGTYQLALCHLHDDRVKAKSQHDASIVLAVKLLKRTLMLIQKSPDQFTFNEIIDHINYLLGAIYLKGSKSFLGREGIEIDIKMAEEYLRVVCRYDYGCSIRQLDDQERWKVSNSYSALLHQTKPIPTLTFSFNSLYKRKPQDKDTVVSKNNNSTCCAVM